MINQTYDDVRLKGRMSLYGVLSVAFVFILSLQLCRSMTLDIYSVDGTRLDLVGYLICHAIGIPLILRAALSKRLMPDVILLCMILIIYIAIVVSNTSIETSLPALFLSRYGILNWFLLGLETAAAASYMHLPVRSPLALPQRRLFLLASLIVGLVLTLMSISYLSDPVYTRSYQSVANNLIVILLIFMIFAQVIWRSKVPVLVGISLLVVGTLAVTATARMQSTSIVGFWIVAILVFFWSALSKLSLGLKALVFVLVSAGSAIYLSSEFFTETLEGTRFAYLLAGGGLSSIDNRLDVMSDFGKQFLVSPVFGNFSAEIVAGSGVGNYPHSLLSFLTHTGLVGTTLLGIILFLIYSRRMPTRRLDLPDRQQFLLMGAILALGTAYVFMTWSVFWFMLGFMCKTPISRVAGEAR